MADPFERCRVKILSSLEVLADVELEGYCEWLAGYFPEHRLGQLRALVFEVTASLTANAEVSLPASCRRKPTLQ